MAQAPFFDSTGKKSSVDLPESIFGSQVNVPIMHEAVRSRLAAVRSGTASTKTRAEVRGGGVKPWRQKGTGRARHGSIREPQWVGGGVAHGPKPRDYILRVNKKARALALRSALTDSARDGRVTVVEMPPFEKPHTKQAVKLLSDWDCQGKTLIVLTPAEREAQTNLWKSFKNLPTVLAVSTPSPYTLIAADNVILSKQAFDAISTRLGDGS